MGQPTVPVRFVPSIRLILAVAALLATTAFVLSVIALTRPIPDPGVVSSFAGTTEGCAWTQDVGPDWLPAIGAEPAC